MVLWVPEQKRGALERNRKAQGQELDRGISVNKVGRHLRDEVQREGDSGL